MNIMELEDQYSIAGFKKRPVIINKGKGAKIWDSDGKEYIDCVMGIGVGNVGHCNDYVIAAIKKQLDELMVCPLLFHNEKRALIIKKLCDITGMQHAFLCNSGTEAVEGAFKFAKSTTKKTEFIAAMNSFHGRTHGSLAATWKKAYREPFEPLMPGVTFVPFNNIDKMREAVTAKTAAIILEVVQGEGGINPADAEYLKDVRKLCDEKKILLIFDEIQTGFGRTGKMFAWQHYNVTPDIMTCAKSIAGGLPMGAIICNDTIEIGDKLHSTTFGGFPVACAAALATIEYIEKNQLCDRAFELGEYFMDQLRKIGSPKVREVKGLGLFIGVDIKEKPDMVLKKLMELGVMALSAGVTVLRLLPPLTITKEEIDVVVERVKEALSG